MARPGSERFEVLDITIHRRSDVTIEFADGVSARFELEELRVNCPCATCRTRRDRDLPAWPTTADPAPLEVRGAELVGAWGLNIEWSDGHATGIYPWESLRQWSDTGRIPFGPDSGLA